MTKIIYPIITSCFLYLFLFNSPLCAASNDNLCALTQCVKIQNGQLWVLSSDDVTYAPYFIKAVGYQPTPIGRYPSDWGYATTDSRSANNNIYDDPNILNRDFSLLQRMNANTIRIWSGSKRTVSCACSNNGRFTNYITNANNTINTNTTQNTLDLAASYGLKVIAGFWLNYLTFDSSNNIGSIDDNGNPLTRQQIINNFVAYVNAFKANRAILFWAIGNENNYEVVNGNPISISAFESAFGVSQGDAIFNWLQQTGNFLDDDGDIIVNLNSLSVLNTLIEQFPTNYNSILNLLKQYSGQVLSPQQLTAWYSLVDAMAQAAHAAEGAAFHPVTVVNGGIAEIGNSADGATDAQLPDLDIWGSNVYLGQSFGSLFSTYAAKSSKPLWISEFGIDTLSVTNSTGINDWGLTLADDLKSTGTYDPGDQSSWDGDLWNEILNNFPVTIGGSVMEYSDEWWKPYEFYCTSPNASQSNNAISAGICNFNQKNYGFPNYTSPDDFSNEEWYGVMSISPNSTVGDPDIVTPRTVYNNLMAEWQSNPWPMLTLNVTGSGAGTISSSSGLGPGINCSFSSPSSTGNCSAAFTKNQQVTLSFSSSNNSTVTNWGVSGCASGVATCNITPDTNIILNVTITSTASPPTVVLNSYIYSFTAPAVVYLVATASETGGNISKVEFYNGSTLIGTITVPEWDAPNYDFLWNNLTPGNYSLTAKAYDTNNNVVSSATKSFTVNGLPTVGLIASSYAASAPAAITLTASPAEAFGSISQVNFYNGTTLLGTSTSSPYTFVWNNVPAGNYTLTAQAIDKSNNMVTSTPITVVVSAGGLPVVSLTSPANNSSYTLPASITLTASASSSKGISTVAFYNGTTLLGTATSSPYTFIWSGMAMGTYNLTAVATDSTAGKSTSAAVSITINPHTAPAVALTSPVNNASYSIPASIILTANASATNATISTVAFYNGTTLLGTATSSPYTFTWSGMATGTYNLTAVATDSTGATSTSAVISVIVNSHVAPAVVLNAYIYSYTAPTDVYLVATASEPGGTISKVEFYNGTTLVATTASPEWDAPNYDYLWFNLPAGNYNLTAKAYDSNNNVSSSVPVTFNVISG